MSRRLSDLFWVSVGQAASALGTLVGVRILTQFLPPEPYGVVSLALGIATLATTLMAGPLTQAAMHSYPEMAARRTTRSLRHAITRGFWQMAPWLLLAGLIGGGGYVLWGGGSPQLVLILLALVITGCWRAANLSLLNAARLHKPLGLWTAADAWARPLSGVAVVAAFGASPEGVLAAYAAISAILVLLFSGCLRREEASEIAQLSVAEANALDSRLWTYAIPLIPLGVISWASSLGDRYIIGGLLSVADAGVYAALYGLASTPFIIVNSTLEQALRPVHQSAVSHRDSARATSILKLWVGATVAICAAGVVALALSHELIANLLVGPAYRHASELMPWIGAGYAIRALSYVFERVCYAYGKTHRVLIVQFCGALIAVALTPISVLLWGLKGAALAVPAYFAVQLATAMFYARRTLREAAEPATVSLSASVATGAS